MPKARLTPKHSNAYLERHLALAMERIGNLERENRKLKKQQHKPQTMLEWLLGALGGRA